MATTNRKSTRTKPAASEAPADVAEAARELGAAIDALQAFDCWSAMGRNSDPEEAAIYRKLNKVMAEAERRFQHYMDVHDLAAVVVDGRVYVTLQRSDDAGLPDILESSLVFSLSKVAGL
jgi:hypothetical protein